MQGFGLLIGPWTISFAIWTLKRAMYLAKGTRYGHGIQALDMDLGQLDKGYEHVLWALNYELGALDRGSHRRFQISKGTSIRHIFLVFTSMY